MKAFSLPLPSSAPPLSVRCIVVYWLPVVAYLGLIFYLSSLPQLATEISLFSGADKFIHLGEYALLSWLLSRALRSASPFSRQAAVIAILFATLYGISDEFHQAFVPGRSAEFLDVVADCGGAVLAQIINYKRN